MSCNGCRVLRKGCSESCVLRPCLQWIESPEAQGHATVFVAKFFGRAGLMSFISAVPELQRPGKTLIRTSTCNLVYIWLVVTRSFFFWGVGGAAALFQSLLFEACGRTINPVNGAVGLLATGNWNLCQAAVQKVLRGGALCPLPEHTGTGNLFTEAEKDGGIYAKPRNGCPSFSAAKRRKVPLAGDRSPPPCDLHLCLTPQTPAASGREEKQRPGSPSMNSEASVTTTDDRFPDRRPRLLNLF
ncbi:LOB domain-containing protein 37 [Platanthera guangdongensis]|uniref:LOB domain-containing protein 37 n=1 Tax=Platanthera guangdongensis TaxID=2320717 RepID=A0ABR2LM96_9ASPA